MTTIISYGISFGSPGKGACANAEKLIEGVFFPPIGCEVQLTSRIRNHVDYLKWDPVSGEVEVRIYNTEHKSLDEKAFFEMCEDLKNNGFTVNIDG